MPRRVTDDQHWLRCEGCRAPGLLRGAALYCQPVPVLGDALPCSSQQGEEPVPWAQAPSSRMASLQPDRLHVSFPGKHYWAYDFAKQPSRQDCEVSSPSLVFDHYTLMQGDSWEDFFQQLFGGSMRSKWGGTTQVMGSGRAGH